MDFEKQWKTEIEKRQARSELENAEPKHFEVLKKFALMLFDQNEAHKKLLLITMELNLTGDIKE